MWDILDSSVIMRMCLVGGIMDMWRGLQGCPICGGTFLLVSTVMNVILMICVHMEILDVFASH